MIKQYRKKPVIIEAMISHGSPLSDRNIINWIAENGTLCQLDLDEQTGDTTCIHINTLEGSMKVSVGDYVIKGIQGEFYPCKPEIFKATYEEVV